MPGAAGMLRRACLPLHRLGELPLYTIEYDGTETREQDGGMGKKADIVGCV